MGTVMPRKLGDGSTRYQAQLLIKRSGKIVPVCKTTKDDDDE